MTLSNEDHLITHAGCMDGAGCAIVFLHFGGNKDNIQFCSPAHERIDSKAIDNRKRFAGTLYLADISVSPAAAEQLDKVGSVRLYDHHKSALPLAKYSWCHINEDNSLCGSKLFYQALNRSADVSLVDLLDAIDDRDRWVNGNPYSQSLHELFSLIGQEAFVERCRQHPYPQLLEHELYGVHFETARKQQYIEGLNVIVRQFGAYRIGFVACEKRYTSDAGHFICEKFNLDYCVLVNSDTVSLRAGTSSLLDMATIAKRYGGGGHKGAAGFLLKHLLGKSLVDQVVESFQLP
jgi:uncharacterized protein